MTLSILSSLLLLLDRVITNIGTSIVSATIFKGILTSLDLT